MWVFKTVNSYASTNYPPSTHPSPPPTHTHTKNKNNNNIPGKWNFAMFRHDIVVFLTWQCSHQSKVTYLYLKQPNNKSPCDERINTITNKQTTHKNSLILFHAFYQSQCDFNAHCRTNVPFQSSKQWHAANDQIKQEYKPVLMRTAVHFYRLDLGVWIVLTPGSSCHWWSEWRTPPALWSKFSLHTYAACPARHPGGLAPSPRVSDKKQTQWVLAPSPRVSDKKQTQWVLAPSPRFSDKKQSIQEG